MRSRSVSIQRPQATVNDGVHRVTAHVAGHDIWFESSDVSLRANTEAFATALLIPALHKQVQLQLTEPVCPTWQQGAQSATAVANRWWQLPLLPPKTVSFATPTPAKAKGTTLCFSGGVDSFHSLLRSKQRLTSLIFVHGYDIELRDRPRFRAFTSSLQQIAAQCGTKSVTVSTNLREHPLVSGAPWNNAHGGALAAIGHLLSDHASSMIVASSVPRSYNIPWGSHWELDPLWSSSAMRIIHDGDDFSREEKAWAIATEPLLTRHLRVCWENRSLTGNCSICDKCVNTMLLLRQVGQLGAYAVFEKPQSFVPLLDALPRTTFVRVYKAMCRRGLASDEEAAVHRLLNRTEQSAKRLAARKRLRDVVNKMLFRR